MYIAKSTLLLSFVALCRFVVADQTPACLLTVVGNQPNPADLSAICGSAASQVESSIKSECGNNTQTALQVFSSTCSAAGYKVVDATVTTSDASSSTATSKPTGSTSATATSGSVATGSATASSTGGSATASTVHGAAPSNHAGSAAAFAAAVFVGVASLL
ncbi:hypothetical protein VTN77DRAFT_1141 [Rasamsonia byssochlamydoides]|uniref:uncharacterized protein n=1 Tax=Rasamsonia byssochlamydoides TaxID=89139 RepID=UPI003742AB3F